MCRFAQRVACVSNIVRVNEATDPLVLVAQLRQENRDLRAQLALLRAGAPSLTGHAAEPEAVKQAVDAFLDAQSPSAADALATVLQGLPGGLTQGSKKRGCSEFTSGCHVDRIIVSATTGLEVLKDKVEEGQRPQSAAADVAALQSRVAELEALLADMESQMQQYRGMHTTQITGCVNMDVLLWRGCHPCRREPTASSTPLDAATNVPQDPQQAQALLQDTHAAVRLVCSRTTRRLHGCTQFAAFQAHCPLVDVIQENKAQLRTQHQAAKLAAAAATDSKAVRADD